MTIQDMNWYVVKLVYQIIRKEMVKPEFDIQWRLISADEQDWAYEKASTLGRIGESIFFNKLNQKIHWKFLGVVDLIKVDSIDDAALLFSQTEEPEDEGFYKSIVKDRVSRLNEINSLSVS